MLYISFKFQMTLKVPEITEQSVFKQIACKNSQFHRAIPTMSRVIAPILGQARTLKDNGLFQKRLIKERIRQLFIRGPRQFELPLAQTQSKV